MAFWHRIKEFKLKLVSYQLRRCFGQTPYGSLLNYTPKNSRSCALESPAGDICRRSADFCNNARFFASSVQAKAKEEEKGTGGPRLNEEITAQFVRLVTDEGHTVVSLSEAWEHARKLKLDLVEVQRNVHPPVCKIMDFRREQYKQKVKEKERAKEKKDVTLKKGDCKEVRFFEKTELKDLKTKADTVLRLMQRGYRVKCIALASPKKGSGRASLKKGSGDDLTEEEIAERERQEEEEKEGLRALLSRLTALLGEEFIVESGPRAEKRQTYVIVRHAKFGPSKKGGAKKIKDVEKVTTAQPTTAESGMETEDEILSDEEGTLDKELELIDDDETARSVADSADDLNRVFDFNMGAKESSLNRMEKLNGPPPDVKSSQMNSSVLNASQNIPVHNYKQADGLPTSSESSLGTENRYKRSEPREGFPSTSSRDNRSPDRLESFRMTPPRFSNQNRRLQSEMNVTSPTGEGKPIRTDSSAFRTAETIKQANPHDALSTGASSYGIFSSTTASSTGKQGVTSEVNSDRNSKFEGGQRAKDEDGSGQARWGIFSKDGPQIGYPSKN